MYKPMLPMILDLIICLLFMCILLLHTRNACRCVKEDVDPNADTICGRSGDDTQ